MKPKVVIIDYTMGNVFSIEKRLKLLGCEVLISAKKEDLEQADKLILPGVGHFGKAMETLHGLNLIESLQEQVLEKKKPILGICLGMQLLANFSEEGNVAGLGWIDGSVKRFDINDSVRNKVPHTGWNSMETKKSSQLLAGMDAVNEFYFVHSYFFDCTNSDDVLGVTTHESEFVSAVSRDNIFGVQFHPEKSHDVGKQLLQNFINL